MRSLFLTNQFHLFRLSPISFKARAPKTKQPPRIPLGMIESTEDSMYSSYSPFTTNECIEWLKVAQERKMLIIILNVDKMANIIVPKLNMV